MSVADVKCPNIGIGPAASDESGLTQVDRIYTVRYSFMQQIFEKVRNSMDRHTVSVE